MACGSSWLLKKRSSLSREREKPYLLQIVDLINGLSGEIATVNGGGNSKHNTLPFLNRLGFFLIPTCLLTSYPLVFIFLLSLSFNNVISFFHLLRLIIDVHLLFMLWVNYFH